MGCGVKELRSWDLHISDKGVPIWSHCLKGNCAQLLRKGKTEPGLLESFFWTLGNTGKDCVKGKDSDNGFICERKPDVSLP